MWYNINERAVLILELTTLFKELGYDIDWTKDFTRYFELWGSWYKGKVKSFHDYKVYNGVRKVNVKRKSLQMAKKVCEDWADLEFNERVSITTDNEETNKKLQKILDDNDFWILCNQGIEKTFALGTGAFVCSVDNLTIDEEGNAIYDGEARTTIQFLTADKIIPLTWDNKGITECAFVDTKTEKGNKITKVSIHKKDDNGQYVIINKFYSNDRNNLKPLPELDYTFNTLGDIPWFEINKPNVCNNIDLDSPYGVSIFANSIDILEGLDIAYDGIPNEYLLGKKRIFIDKELTKINSIDGSESLTFDVNDIAFYALPSDFNSSNSIGLQDNTQQLRIAEHTEGIQFMLNLLSTKTGFGQTYYKFDNGTVATATEVVSQNSQLFRTLKKHEIILESNLHDIVKIIAHIETTFCNNPMPFGNVIIDFDDSIIEDKQKQREIDKADMSIGIMRREEYRAKYYGETEEEALKKLPEVESLV